MAFEFRQMHDLNIIIILVKLNTVAKILITNKIAGYFLFSSLPNLEKSLFKFF